MAEFDRACLRARCAVMSEGDMVVLGCLDLHRARLSRACEKVLTDNGQ